MASQSTDERALTLLGQGIEPSTVASAIGVSPSYISQLMSNKEFEAKVVELRVENLVKHSERDSAYDRIEESLQGRLEKMIPMMFKPMEVVKTLQVINAAKRRGPGSPDSITQTQEVISLTLPTTIINQYMITPKLETNSLNQVIKVGEQDIITVQSNRMEDLLSNQKSSQLKELPYVLPESTNAKELANDRNSG
jgi:hypothetical protein